MAPGAAQAAQKTSASRLRAHRPKPPLSLTGGAEHGSTARLRRMAHGTMDARVHAGQAPVKHQSRQRAATSQGGLHRQAALPAQHATRDTSTHLSRCAFDVKHIGFCSRPHVARTCTWPAAPPATGAELFSTQRTCPLTRRAQQRHLRLTSTRSGGAGPSAAFTF